MSQFASTLYPQTNPSNPILISLRSVWDADAANFIAWSAKRQIDTGAWDSLPARQRNHANRVLTRLVALSG